jgi:hypothetical protein
MDQAILDSLQQTLVKQGVTPHDVRNELWSHLDRAPLSDEDAIDLLLILEKMELPAALEEFQRTLSQILGRKPRT